VTELKKLTRLEGGGEGGLFVTIHWMWKGESWKLSPSRDRETKGGGRSFGPNLAWERRKKHEGSIFWGTHL